MSPKGKKLLAAVMELPKPERQWLLDEIESSLVDTKEVEKAWKKEIKRRIGEIESGKVKLIPWEDVRKELWARANAARRVPPKRVAENIATTMSKR